MALLRKLLIALGASLLLGLAIGTALRLRLERPTWYIGASLPLAPFPLDIRDPRSSVLDPGHHEEQIG